MKSSWFLVAVIATNLTFSALADFSAKMWGVNNDHRWLAIGLSLNVITVLTFMTVVRLGGLAIAPTIVLVISIMVDVIIGASIFRESISGVQWLGIGVSLAGIALVGGLIK